MKKLNMNKGVQQQNTNTSGDLILQSLMRFNVTDSFFTFFNNIGKPEMAEPALRAWKMGMLAELPKTKKTEEYLQYLAKQLGGIK